MESSCDFRCFVLFLLINPGYSSTRIFLGNMSESVDIIDSIEIKSNMEWDRSLCTEYNETTPKVFSLRSSTNQYTFQGDPRRSSVDYLGIRSTSNAFSTKQFNCTFHIPIRWVFHLDPLETYVNINIDFAERISSDGITEYSANFKLLYYPDDFESNESKLFSCEPYQLHNPCQRSFIQVPRGYAFQSEPVKFPDESLSVLSERLLNSSMEEQISHPLLKWIECEKTLEIKVERGNMIFYQWNFSSLPLEQKAFRSNETTFYENAFRLRRNIAKASGCARVLGEDEPCTKCTRVGDANRAEWNITSEYSLNAVIFYAEFGDGSSIQKGHFSVPNFGEREHRRFYFDWQLTPDVIQEEMIQLEVPLLIYANVPFEAKCLVSFFVFSYGTYFSSSDELENGTNPVKPGGEQWMPFGYRQIKRVMNFNSSGTGKWIECRAPLRRTEDWVKKSIPVTVQDPIPPSINDSARNSSEFPTIQYGIDDIVLDCNVTAGNPKPKFNWNFPEKVNLKSLQMIQDEDLGINRIIFPKWTEDLDGTYVCKAQNKFGLITRAVTFETEGLPQQTSTITLAVSSGLGAMALFLGMAIGFLIWSIWRQRLDFEKQTQMAIEEFRNGMSQNMDDMAHANFSFLQMPYNEDFEVIKELWEIEEKILGSGQFGIVRMGTVTLEGQRKVKVAVKTLKSAVEIDEFKSFLFELKIMAFLGQHKNIVSLVAACSDAINDRDIFIGVEFCDNGCLLDYLRRYRNSFRSMVTPEGKLITDVAQIVYGSTEQGTYMNISSYTISTEDLYRWSYHIAAGMEYLGVKKVLHGDLAARNVLLTQRRVAKVGDFGLSRVLFNSSNYTKKTQTALPWKWMALESLKERVFSVDSDKWGYGITLAELFSLGQSPYPGIGWSPDFIIKLENGMRMERSVHCTTSIYKVMQACWDNVPHHRPKYCSIKRKLSQGLRRLSTIAKEPETPIQGQRQTSLHSSPPMVTTSLGVDDITIEGIYHNMKRSTAMNYYKNC